MRTILVRKEELQIAKRGERARSPASHMSGSFARWQQLTARGTRTSAPTYLPPGHLEALYELLDLPDLDVAVGGGLLVRHRCGRAWGRVVAALRRAACPRYRELNSLPRALWSARRWTWTTTMVVVGNEPGDVARVDATGPWRRVPLCEKSRLGIINGCEIPHRSSSHRIMSATEGTWST